jgi:hypothetical protein
MSWHDLAGPKHIYSAIAKNSNGRLEFRHKYQDAPGKWR